MAGRFPHKPVNQFFHALTTLSPVRRAAAFFVFLGLFSFAACQQDETAKASDILDEQTRIFSEMTTILTSIQEGSDPEKAAAQLTNLAKDLKALKIELQAIEPPETAEGGVLPQQEAFIEATLAFQKAQQDLFMSGKLTPEISRAIMAHHNAAPLKGEGSTD